MRTVAGAIAFDIALDIALGLMRIEDLANQGRKFFQMRILRGRGGEMGDRKYQSLIQWFYLAWT